MSVQNAFGFLRRVREDPDLAARVRSLGRAPELEQIVRIAAEAGFEITTDELRAAHRQDAMLRWAAYRADPSA